MHIRWIFYTYLYVHAMIKTVALFFSLLFSNDALSHTFTSLKEWLLHQNHTFLFHVLTFTFCFILWSETELYGDVHKDWLGLLQTTEVLHQLHNLMHH